MKCKSLKRNILVAAMVILVLCIGLSVKNKTNTLNSNSIKEGITKELDENLIGAYIQNGEDYTPTSDIPTSGYEFNEEKSYCKIGDVIQENISLSYDMDTQTLTVSPITKEGMKCYLYFDERKIPANEYILASANKPTGQTTDWTGQTTYYYTGNPNNWIQFSGFWWRIIRINGNGSVRMIYQGNNANTTGTGTQISTGAFNSSYNRSYYVGLVYKEDEQYGYGTNSTIMNTLNTWYNNNLASYEADYIDTGAGFCSDRNLQSGSWSASGSHNYAAYGRLYNKGSESASLQCSDVDILSQDNGKLPNPIGLITADEAALAGITYNNVNTESYLYTNSTYWTMSPYDFNGSAAVMFIVFYNSLLYYNGVLSPVPGVRPVINIRADVALTGSGTTSDPFKVVGAS